jgi:hypothetical protein
MTFFDKFLPSAQLEDMILVPSDFTYYDSTTQIVHQGAKLLDPDSIDSDYGIRVMGYTRLCTDELEAEWERPPNTAQQVVTCLSCLGATPQ